MEWKGNDIAFKGYVIGKGKQAIMKVKNVQLLSWDAVQRYRSFGTILNQYFVDISFDTNERSQKFWDMAEKNNWKCLIFENLENGHIHSIWRIPNVNVQDVLAINMSELRNTNRIPLNMAVSFDNPQQIENSIPPECTIEIITWEKNEK